MVTINGMTRLVKEYGPLHTLYPVYLLSYFISMVVVIVRSFRKKTLSSPKYAVFLAAAVLLAGYNLLLLDCSVYDFSVCINHCDFSFRLEIDRSPD